MKTDEASSLELELVVVHKSVHNLFGVLGCNGKVINIYSYVLIFVTEWWSQMSGSALHGVKPIS